mgnify:CR=1 FL=1
MWIYTPNSAISIVMAKGTEGTKLMVRSRKREHLTNFGYQDSDIVETPDNDYQFRVFTSPESVMKKMMISISKIDYGNYKDRAKEVGEMPENMLADIWQATFNHLDQRVF